MHCVWAFCENKLDFFTLAQKPLVGQDLLIIEASRWHSRHTTLGRSPPDEWSAQHRDLYPTTHITHKRQTFMPPAGFEPTIPAREQLQTHALDRAATCFSKWESTWHKMQFEISSTMRKKLADASKDMITFYQTIAQHAWFEASATK